MLDLSAACDGLASWRRLVLLVRPSMAVVCDDLQSDSPRVFSWLAHCLSRPDIDAGTVTITRPPAGMELRLFTSEGQMADPTWTDESDPPVNAGVPAKYAVDMPDQHHLRWDAQPADRRRFAAVMALNGATAETHLAEGVLAAAIPPKPMTGGRPGPASTLRVGLDPDSPWSVTLDGSAVVSSPE
jgi:hypothetical protein